MKNFSITSSFKSSKTKKSKIDNKKSKNNKKSSPIKLEDIQVASIKSIRSNIWEEDGVVNREAIALKLKVTANYSIYNFKIGKKKYFGSGKMTLIYDEVCFKLKRSEEEPDEWLLEYSW